MLWLGTVQPIEAHQWLVGLSSGSKYFFIVAHDILSFYWRLDGAKDNLISFRPVAGQSMSVLAEGFSIIVRRSTIDSDFPGGIAAYRRLVPNKTFCADQHLTRVGFLDWPTANEFLASLRAFGLTHQNVDEGPDVGVLHQDDGQLAVAFWLEWGRDEAGRSIAWLYGTDAGQLAVPEGWPEDTATKRPILRESTQAVKRARAVEFGVAVFVLVTVIGWFVWRPLAFISVIFALASVRRFAIRHALFWSPAASLTVGTTYGIIMGVVVRLASTIAVDSTLGSVLFAALGLLAAAYIGYGVAPNPLLRLPDEEKRVVAHGAAVVSYALTLLAWIGVRALGHHP